MFARLGMFPTIAGGVVVVVIAGWVILSQTGAFAPDEPVPVVQAQSQPAAEPAETPAPVEETPVETSEASAPVEETPVETSEAPAEDQPMAEDAAEAAEEMPAETAEDTTVAEQVDEPAPIPAPDFDVVRVESDGTTVVAGTGPAGWDLAILVDGQEMATTQIDSTGQFVAFLDLGIADIARVMTLRATDGQTIRLSDAQAIIAPVDVQIAEVESEALAEEAPEAEAPEDVVKTAETEEPATSAAPTETASATPDTEATEESVALPETETAEPEQPAQVAVTEDAVGEAEMAEAETAETTQEATPTVSTTDTDTDTDAAEAEADATAAPAADPVETAEAAAAAEAAPAPTVAETETPTDAATTEAPATLPTETTEPAPAAPAVLLVDEDGVDILQPASSAPELLEELSIAAITYADDGSVFLTGFSPAGFLRVYVNNQQVVVLEIPEPGEWKAELVDVAPGVYTLRVDQVDDNGDVVQRVETPFKREEPQKVVEAAQSRKPLVSQEVVQPGSTLWAISRQAYGSGVLFVRIFEANKNQIRNPDLIYPGQIFELPAPPGAQKTKRGSGQ